jgi:hypothetical protein
MKKVQINKHRIFKNRVSKLKVSLLSTLLVLGFAASPAQANHYRHVIAPLATVAALAYLFDHGDHHSTYTRRSYRSHGYRSDGYRNNGQHHGYRKHSRRKHSHSSGGYSHKSKNRYQH